MKFMLKYKIKLRKFQLLNYIVYICIKFVKTQQMYKLILLLVFTGQFALPYTEQLAFPSIREYFTTWSRSTRPIHINEERIDKL